MSEKITREEMAGQGQNDVVASIRIHQDATILDIRGDLDGSCEASLAGAFAEGMKASGRILLNLSGLGRMDVEGAGLLLINASRASRKNIRVLACGLSEPYQDVFHLTGLDEAIGVYDRETEALCCRQHPGETRPEGFRPYSAPSRPPAGWAPFAECVSVRAMPPEAMNINVNGRRVSFPATGFGRLVDKRYFLRVNDPEIDPRDVVAVWRSEFPDFWPKGNRVFPSAGAPIAPGTAAVLNLALPGGLVLATGIMVIHADERSFSFSTIQGHILSGWITFSSFRRAGATVIQVHPLFRTGDPMMEIGFRLGAARQEDRFWHETLGNLARRLGTDGKTEQTEELIDFRLQWRHWKNIRYSAAIRSFFYLPLHLLKKGHGRPK
jgi:anti-anti-sigma factor